MESVTEVNTAVVDTSQNANDSLPPSRSLCTAARLHQCTFWLWMTAGAMIAVTGFVPVASALILPPSDAITMIGHMILGLVLTSIGCAICYHARRIWREYTFYHQTLPV